MRRTLVLAACIGALLAGCGNSGSPTPAACLAGPGSYLAALRAAPGQVRLAGQTAISSCLVEEQSGGDLSRVGSALVRASTTLNATARRVPGGQANVALGYLLGAVERGAENTNGIHADLVRRVDAAAEFSPGGRPLPAAFRSSLARGEQAGRSSG